MPMTDVDGEVPKTNTNVTDGYALVGDVEPFHGTNARAVGRQLGSDRPSGERA